MATLSQSTIEKGFDMVQDFLCSTCEDKKLEKWADYYCESCVKFYCQECIYMHGKLFTKHSPKGRRYIRKWPLSKKVEDFILKCDVHKEENLSMFCEDHRQLCCRNCAILHHRLCKKVILLSDKVKNTFMDLEQVSNTIQITLAELNELRENQEASIQFVQCSFEEQLHKIQESREKIIAALNILEMKTLTEMKDTLTKLQASLKSDVDKCATFEDELKQFRDAIEEIRNKDKHKLSHIANIKCKNKIQLIEQYRRENFVQVKSSITFQPNSEIEKFLSNLSGLGKIEHIAQPLTVRGNPDQIIRIEGHSEYVISVEGDSDKERFCSIKDICVLPSGQVLLADADYNNVKLLNEHYQLVTRYRLSGPPWGLCQITSSEVVFSVGSEVQFIKVKNNRLEAGRKIWLEHQCRVCCCAVSPTGDKLYIISYFDHSLLTLAMDGAVLATFMDPELQYPRDLDVTPAGQVLVCGSETILQVDSKGSRKLETLTKPPYSVRCNPNVTPCPYSVCYNSNTCAIIAGMWRIDKILVYKVI